MNMVIEQHTVDLTKYEPIMIRALDDSGHESDVAMNLLRKKLKRANIDPRTIRLFDKNEPLILAAERAADARQEGNLNLIADLQNQITQLEERLSQTVDSGVVSSFAIMAETAPQPIREPRQEARPAFEWSQYPDVELALSRRFLAGESIAALTNEARELTGADLSQNQLTQRFFNGHPPHALRVNTIVLGARLTWEELWTIGRALYNKAWINKSFIGLGNLDPRKQGTDLSDISMEAIDALRSKAIAKMAAAEAEIEHVMQLVKTAGTRGLTRSQLRKEGCDARRVSERIDDFNLVVVNPDAPKKDQRIVHYSLVPGARQPLYPK